MKVNKEKIRYILQFFFDNGDATWTAEIVKSVYGADTVTDNYVQFYFCQFRSGIFDVKDAPKMMKDVKEIIELGWHVSSRGVSQELKGRP